MEKSRKTALKELLRPIKWNWSSSVESRMRLVSYRHEMVNNVYPFLTKKEKKLADDWRKKESHDGLWD